MKNALDLYERALTGTEGPGSLFRFRDGSSTPLEVSRYLAPADGDDAVLLAGVAGPVLDVGCGPGRHLRALTAQGVYALGIDLSPLAVGFACANGGRAIVTDVFGEVPGVGAWATALLLDGNIGIGGDPEALLRRVRELLLAEGAVLVELEPAANGTRADVARIETGSDASAWFPWARVSADGIGELARTAGFDLEWERRCGERFFACLRAVPSR